MRFITCDRCGVTWAEPPYRLAIRQYGVAKGGGHCRSTGCMQGQSVYVNLCRGCLDDFYKWKNDPQTKEGKA